MSNVIYAIINSWNWKCVRFGDRIYFTIVSAHTKCSVRFWYKNARRTPFTLTRFYEVIVQEILNFFPEILLFCRVHSVWMLFHRFWTIKKCQHHDEFCQFWMECLEISAHIRESTVSVQVFFLNQGEIVSGRDPLRCQNSVVLTTRDQISQRFPQNPFDFVHEGQN